MKPYGMTRYDHGDRDAKGSSANGRATGVYSASGRAYHSLRGGRKAAARRTAKRVARRDGLAEVSA